MTENYVTQKYNNHSIYGGNIDIEDFDTNSPNKKRINNQIKSLSLHQYLIQKENIRKEYKKYMHMTLEELREMKLISNTNGRPHSTLTNKKWQKEFNIRKMVINPHDKNHTRMVGKYSIESGKWNEETMGEYHGCTNWQEYCSFINDILSNIRMGQKDYCYYIYQIMDLARFHFNTLRTKYCDGYWEVWLER
ncbi:hypothetical protein [Thomasclavelia cocleata]|uniref:hypothetical protein n=1 Tax=Thomasclavelia cocleata TaxID=69824 RepID=UPI00255806AA|nr:hypothetical protein [Thomasclavelia cocleata]